MWVQVPKKYIKKYNKNIKCYSNIGGLLFVYKGKTHPLGNCPDVAMKLFKLLAPDQVTHRVKLCIHPQVLGLLFQGFASPKYIYFLLFFF